jgi:cob(I)alamin adenosyltransferase
MLTEKKGSGAEAAPLPKKGLVYVFTGEGKGKTSAGMWTAVRAALDGQEVAIVHWYKEARWPTTDQKIKDLLPNLHDYLMGSGFYKLPTDHASSDEHKASALAALAKAGELLETVDVLVLDEIINAVSDGLLDEDTVLDLVGSRGTTHLILTGRGASRVLIDIADLVTEMKKIKHPFDKGKLAVKGLDF